jgi:hypothetical protein
MCKISNLRFFLSKTKVTNHFQHVLEVRRMCYIEGYSTTLTKTTILFTSSLRNLSTCQANDKISCHNSKNDLLHNNLLKIFSFLATTFFVTCLFPSFLLWELKHHLKHMCFFIFPLLKESPFILTKNIALNCFPQKL